MQEHERNQCFRRGHFADDFLHRARRMNVIVCDVIQDGSPESISRGALQSLSGS